MMMMMMMMQKYAVAAGTAADIYDDADDNDDNRQPVLILVCHLIPHCSVITMHLLVAFHALDEKLQLNNDKFGAQARI
jgi:hypothetical protein